MRVLKDPEVRRNEILDAAEEMFEEKGFDNTSTNDILEKCGIARGTLYYHFKSKEDILDGVIERITEKMTERAAAVCADKSIPVLDRLTASVLSLNMNEGVGKEVIRQINKPSNALMHQKTQALLINRIVPVLSGLVNEGIEQGIFKTKYVTEAVEMIMLYSYAVFDEITEQSEEEKRRRVLGFIYNTERLFGTDEGELFRTIMPLFERNGNGGNSNEN